MTVRRAVKYINISAIFAIVTLIVFLGIHLYFRNDIQLTEPFARQIAENIFQNLHDSYKKDRSQYYDPVVEIQNGDAMIIFRPKTPAAWSILITLGRDGSQGVGMEPPTGGTASH
jgi:hypothetical protein